MSSSSRIKSIGQASPDIPADYPVFPTAGDREDVYRLVSSVGTPDAVRETSG